MLSFPLDDSLTANPNHSPIRTRVPLEPVASTGPIQFGVPEDEEAAGVDLVPLPWFVRSLKKEVERPTLKLRQSSIVGANAHSGGEPSSMSGGSHMKKSAVTLQLARSGAAPRESRASDFFARLRGVESQLVSARQLYLDGEPCFDVIEQVAAAQSELGMIAANLLQDHLYTCQKEASDGRPEPAERLLTAISRCWTSSSAR